MGIVNVTPDSFSDGGRFLAPEAAVEQARQLAEHGAAILDIGGESTRPFSEPVSMEEELHRVIPVIRAIRKETEIPISIDTTKAEVARQALAAGADIINDISAFRFDPLMVEVAREHNAPVILMHMKGTPGDMQINPQYSDVVKEVASFLRERVRWAMDRGIKRNRIIVDPGIGFGKGLQDNLALINHVNELRVDDLPVLIGPSRKAFIGTITGIKTPEERDHATLGAVAAAILRGAQIVRVHNVALTAQVVKVIDAIRSN